MAKKIEVIIVGAGPYGISLGLHLKARGIGFRVFGPAMHTWLKTMPTGMDLKSEGYASTIGDPSGKSLATFCSDHGLPYRPVALPVPLSTFGAYGVECYRRLQSDSDPRQVSHIATDSSGYRVVLEDGEELSSKKVVVATGISHFAFVPDQFGKVDSAFVSHSSAYSDLSGLAGKALLVVGAGASATDLAVLAAEAGANVTLTCRKDILWNQPRSEKRSFYERIRWPESCMGPGVRSCLYEKSPLAFKTLPSSTRDKIAREFAGPAAGWPIHERFDKAVSVLAHSQITSMQEMGSKLQVEIQDQSSQFQRLEVDQLICATGYHSDLTRLKFLAPEVREKVGVINGSPVLSANFESSSRDLYFLGKPSALTFGPLMRFVCGTEYAAKRLSRHLAA